MSPILHEIFSSGVMLEPVNDGIKATGALSDHVRNLIRANKPALLIELTRAPHYRWRLSTPDSGVHEVCFVPPKTLAEITGDQPGTTAVPLPDEVDLSATCLCINSERAVNPTLVVHRG